MALGRIVSGHWSPWPAAVGLVSYNANFFWGFQNYIFSIPFAILSLGIWLWSEKFTPRIRLSIFLPLVPILYLMHFFAFAALAIGVFGREIQRLIESRSTWRIVLLESALLSIPFVIPLLWLVIQTLYSEPSPSGTHTEFGPWFRRIEVISSPVSLVTELGISKALTISSFAIFCTLLFLIGSLAINTVGKLDVVKEMRGPLAALSVAALLAPSWLNGVAFVHHRLPVIALAAFFASSKWRLRSTKAYGLFWMFLTVMLIGRAVAFARFADQHSNETLDFLAVVEEVPSGSRLLPVRATNSAMETRLWHLAGYAVMSREVFVPTLFQGVHALSVREEWSKFATPAFHAVSAAWLQPIEGEYPRLLRFVKDWDTKFTHLIMLNSELTDLENLEQLKVLRNRGRFTLFQIQHYENAMQ